MQNIQIKTPLNVNVTIRHAEVGWRLLAFIIDVLVIMGYVWLLSISFSWLGLSGSIWEQGLDKYYDINTFLSIVYLILFFPAMFYSLWTETVFNGQTPGKMICRIRVVKLDGYQAGFQEYFTRWAFRLVDFWTGMFLMLFLIPIFGEEAGSVLGGLLLMMSGGVAFFFIIRTPNSQRLGDVVAGTTVLKIKEKYSIDSTILEDIIESYVPTYSQVIRLSDNDARIIKDTFTIARKNRDYKTLKRLRTKLESVMDVQAQGEDVEFIETVMKDFNYYTQKF